MTERMSVVGIGADGWAGLSEPARTILSGAEVVMGGARQLALVPDTGAERVAWPSPLLPALPDLLAAHAGRRICVLASGDPMFYGIGTTLVRLVGPANLHVVPHVGAVSLACARLGWAVESVTVVSAVGRPVETLHRYLTPGRRLLVLSAGASTYGDVLSLLDGRGYGGSEVTVLSQLGGPSERIGTEDIDGLNIVAIECRSSTENPLLASVPGLPDDAYESDGQLTKREVRAVTLARLVPAPGQLLWDIGAGSGSIGIEWLRVHPSCRAVAVEHRDDRADRVVANAKALGVPGLTLVRGAAPGALVGLPAPDAVFVGGAVSVAGVIEAGWAALRPGGRLVANAVTLETEAVLTGWYARLGGDLTRIEISRAAAVGGFTGWRPAMPVTQWVVTKK